MSKKPKMVPQRATLPFVSIAQRWYALVGLLWHSKRQSFVRRNEGRNSPEKHQNSLHCDIRQSSVYGQLRNKVAVFRLVPGIVEQVVGIRNHMTA